MSVNNKRHHWIGVGVILKKKKAVLDNARKVDTPPNPGTQSIIFQDSTPIPKSNQALLQKRSSTVLSLLDLYKEEIDKNKQTDAEDKQDDLDAARNKINSADKDNQDKEIDKNLCTTALIILQQISKDQITDPV
jgi:hypothetical protein